MVSDASKRYISPVCGSTLGINGEDSVESVWYDTFAPELIETAGEFAVAVIVKLLPLLVTFQR